MNRFKPFTIKLTQAGWFKVRKPDFMCAHFYFAYMHITWMYSKSSFSLAKLLRKNISNESVVLTCAPISLRWVFVKLSSGSTHRLTFWATCAQAVTNMNNNDCVKYYASNLRIWLWSNEQWHAIKSKLLFCCRALRIWMHMRNI